MIIHSLNISFIVSIIIPALSLAVFPEIIDNKGIDIVGKYSIIYIGSLFILLTGFLYLRQKVESKMFLAHISTVNANKPLIWMGILFIFTLYLGRLLYYIYISESPYVLLVEQGNQIVTGPIKQVINYYFTFTNFKFYPLIQGVIVISIPKKYWALFFCSEIAYSFITYSKFILFSSIILFILVNLKENSRPLKILLIGFIITLLFVISREVFGQLRQGGFLLESIDGYEMIIGAISRVQSLFPVIYAENVVNEWMYGKSLCRVIGYLTPDSLVNLPKHCGNIDEDTLLFYFGLTDLRIINKDLITLWSEPFINFGVFGIGLFGLTISLVEKFSMKFGDSSFGAVFSWVIVINCLMSHNSWSAFFGTMSISFITLWFLSSVTRLLSPVDDKLECERSD